MNRNEKLSTFNAALSGLLANPENNFLEISAKKQEDWAKIMTETAIDLTDSAAMAFQNKYGAE